MASMFPTARIRLWDLPVRLFHWALVALIVCAWWTAENHLISWHRLTGYAILTLVLFRIVWGFLGSTTARFSHFLRGPGAVGAYVGGHMFRRGSPGHAGHNPLGGWSVVGMLGLLLLQVLLGFFSVDVDGLESGPFAYLVSFDTGRWAAETHELVFNLLLALIGLHVLAILFYRVVRGENLVGAMVSGSRRWTGNAPILRFASPLLALIVLAGAALLVWVAVGLFGKV